MKCILPMLPRWSSLGGGKPVVDPPEVPYLTQRRWALSMIHIGENGPPVKTLRINKAPSHNEYFKLQHYRL